MLTLFAYGVSLGQSSLDADLSSRERRNRRSANRKAQPYSVEVLNKHRSEKSQYQHPPNRVR